MKNLFLKILNEYDSAKTEDFKEHALAKILRQEAKHILKEDTLIDDSKYKIEGSPGKGNWADIPCIAIFDKDITDTATRGYYIVYLFRADMSGVYLSLNQGWTYFKDRYKSKDGKLKINQVSNAWKNILSSTLKDFSYEKINLNSTNKSTDLAKGYELGHICGKFYSLDNMPEEKELIRDLQNLLGVYRELKGRLKDLSIEKTNDYLIVNSSLGSFETETSDDEFYGIEGNIENYSKSSLQKENIPTSFKVKEEESRKFIARKVDYLKKAKNQKKLGLLGELMVLQYEVDFLKDNGREKLADKVKHISETDGDGAGYDILSFDMDGSEKYRGKNDFRR